MNELSSSASYLLHGYCLHVGVLKHFQQGLIPFGRKLHSISRVD